MTTPSIHTPDVKRMEEAAAAVAKIVADECHAPRKPHQAQARYATIYQAAYLGSIATMKALAERNRARTAINLATGGE